MATPPTVIEHTASSSWTTTTSPKTLASTLDIVVDDLIISAVSEENEDLNEDWTWTDSLTGISWTEDARTPGVDDADSHIQSASGVCTGTGSTTVTLTKTAGSSGAWGFGAIQFRVHGGLGTIASSPGAGGNPSWNVTTTNGNSALVVIMADWGANDGASRAYKSINGSTGIEIGYAFNSLQYTVYMLYYADVGAAGVKTVGLDTPGTGDFVMRAVEVLGTTSSSDPGWGKYLLEDGSGYYEMEGVTDDFLLDTAASDPNTGRPRNIFRSNPALNRSFNY